MKKIQFSLSAETINILEEIKETTGATSLVEVVYNSIDFNNFLLKEMSAGNRIVQMKKNGDKRQIIFPTIKI